MKEAIDQQLQAQYDALAEKVAKEVKIAQMLVRELRKCHGALTALTGEVMLLPPCGVQKIQLIQQLISTGGKLDTACALFDGVEES